MCVYVCVCGGGVGCGCVFAYVVLNGILAAAAGLMVLWSAGLSEQYSSILPQPNIGISLPLESLCANEVPNKPMQEQLYEQALLFPPTSVHNTYLLLQC